MIEKIGENFTHDMSNKLNSININDLLKQYKSLHLIPDSELDKAGYSRLEDADGTMRVLRKGAIDNKALRQEREREKILHKPFGLIPLEINTKTEKFLPIRQDQFQDFIKIVHDSEKHYDECDITYRQEPDISLLSKDFTNFVDQIPELNSVSTTSKDNITLECVYGFFRDLTSSFDINDFVIEKNHYDSLEDMIFTDFAEIDADSNDPYISESKAEVLYNLLEKTRGQITNPDLYKQYYDKNILLPFFANWEETPESILLNNMKKNGIVSKEDFDLFFLKKFLAWKEFVSITDDIKDFTKILDLRDYLSNIKKDKLPSFVEERNLAQSMKDLSVEEKIKLSQDLKQVKAKIAEEKRTIGAIIKCITPYNKMAEYGQSFIENIQNKLKRTKSKDQTTETIYLDATPDEKYDKDSGEISGDCTKGKPLRFNNPNLPLYNVKVFDNNKNHIGNIYLLKTNEYEPGEADNKADEEIELLSKPSHDNSHQIKNSASENFNIWHLDAIQIPRAMYEWDEVIPKIIERIGEEAAKQHVRHITVNQEKLYISNYDYIQNAVITYMAKHHLNNKPVFIKIPEERLVNIENEDHSPLQGSGIVFGIWNNQ